MSQKITRLSIGDKNNVVSSEAELPPLQDEDVRIQVLFSNINKNDLLQLEGKNNNDFFGTEVVGRVIETGKLVGHCKKDQIVGVFY
jgi:NADPH:quinone reductase-like Zn-dependent oxidoreductase